MVPQLAGDTATFATTNGAIQTVTVDGLQHVGTLTLNPVTSGYVIATGTAGSTIYMNNGASAAAINNATLNNTISATLNLLSSNTNVNVAPGTNLTFTGTTNGTGKLTVVGGTGSLTLNGIGAWTGGTEVGSGSIIISASAGTASQINNAGVGVTTLNGGTLNFTTTAGTTTLPAGFVLNIGASDGTLNTGGATSGTGGKVLTNSAPGFLTGSGTLTKTGGGDLQITGPSIGFTGAVVLQQRPHRVPKRRRTRLRDHDRLQRPVDHAQRSLRCECA